jgi:hypothetical protein
LQDSIYELSLEQRVEFLLTNLDNLDSRFSLPNHTSVDQGSDEAEVGKSKSGNSGELTGTEPEPDSVLMFKICASTPLLLVSKRVNADVRKLLETKRRVFKSTIHRDHLINPSVLFINSCSQSRFSFVATGSHAGTFWTSILPQMEPYFQNLVIRQEDSRSTAEDRRPVFTHLLPQHFIGLRTMAFEVPYSLEQSIVQLRESKLELGLQQTTYSHNDQLVLACGMLASEKLDVVLVFYQNAGQDNRVNLHYLIHYLEDKLCTGFTISYQKNLEFFDEFPENVYRRNGITSFSGLPNAVKIIRRAVPKLEYAWVEEEKIPVPAYVPVMSNWYQPGY